MKLKACNELILLIDLYEVFEDMNLIPLGIPVDRQLVAEMLHRISVVGESQYSIFGVKGYSSGCVISESGHSNTCLFGLMNVPVDVYLVYCDIPVESVFGLKECFSGYVFGVRGMFQWMSIVIFQWTFIWCNILSLL